MGKLSEPSRPVEAESIVRDHLRDLLASELFANSPKLSRFLEFTVERTLAGEGNALKEYRLGVEIYGRPETYDPRTDPIVRVEARRLRAKLNQFYAGKAEACPVQIEFPKGGYAPVFRLRDQVALEPSQSDFPHKSNSRRLLLIIAAAASLSAATIIVFLRAHPTASPHEPVLTKLTAFPGLSAWPALSADGEQVAYASDRSAEGQLDIWVQRLAAGEPVRLTHEPGTRTEPSFSADGRLVAYRSERDDGGIYVISSQGGGEKLLVALGQRPRFSPDGKWLAYWIARRDSASGNDELYLLTLPAGPSRRIAPDFTGASLPNWSSDGKRLLFRGTSTSPETMNWWVTDLQGGRPIATNAIDVLIHHRMIQAVGWDFRPFVWVDDKVLFSARLGEVTNIWQLHLSPVNYKATGAAERLTSGSDFHAYPSMVNRPDGKPTLAFADTIASINVWSLPVQANTGKVTGDLQAVTHELATWTSYPSLSEDRTKLVHLFVRSREKILLYIRDLKSGLSAKVYPNPPTFPHAKISPDGSRVAYRNEEDSRDAIYLFRADVQHGDIQAHRICADCGRPMDWLKDNRKLLYATSRGRSAIWLLDTESGEKTELLNDPARDLEAARISPSGEWIAFCARTDSGGRIFVARFDSARKQSNSPWIPISGSSEKDLIPAWSPNGNLLYLLSDRDRFSCIWAQPLDPGTKRPAAPAFPVRHFHQFRNHLASPPPECPGLSVVGDRLIFSLFDLTGNIWIAKWQ